ncbi:imidazolonepropionase [Micrococcus sp. EYE_162]|uniref:imidazolonepropionase n=1 Tax=unclassified Micrococcus TaxID=2620948 RepID=UPI0020039CC1|nr:MULTISPECIES: imidazolonepropionase [unclassified Micrococcus]MCK6095406.1 imidazolonepropionase [Micrococcus sp. EYE_212]MCK6171481.1 imidazolonepropionase [Micrococcus sp. EYE_162]
MRSTLITDIAELTTVDPEGRVLADAAVVVEDERIAWIGAAAEAPGADERVSVGGRAVLPGWVDSHTHLVFDGDRSAEFEARMAGESYAAGGIGVTTSATREASDERLRALVAGRVADAVAGGTTYLETKTGYGLSVEEEARHARLLSELKAEGQIDEVTFLGAHLVPKGREAEDYLDDVVGPMLDAVREHVGWIDVFCDKGAFDAAQTRRVLEAGTAAGLRVRLHGNQIEEGPGVGLAVEFGAASVDHVNFLADADVEALAGTWGDWDRASAAGTPGTVAGCLPACDLSTRAPLAPARRLLDAGIEIALASNCNPGTSYTTSMNFNVATAVLQMGLTLAEALRAATLGGAIGLRAQDRVGSLEVGKRADLHVLDAPAAIHLAYRPGMPLTHAVWRAGRRVV